MVNSLILADEEMKWEHQLVYYGIEELLPAYQRFCHSHSVPYRFIRKKKGLFRLPGKDVITAFVGQNPDIIILHSPTLIIPAWLYSFFFRKKLFVVEHTSHTTKGKPEKFASFLSLLLAYKVVCLSENYRKEFQKNIPFLNLKKRVAIIRNGINLTVFSPGAGRTNSEFHIGMAGRLNAPKNQQMIIELAIEGFAKGNLDCNVHFHFAGVGDQLENLKHTVTTHNLNDQIHFHGLLEESEMIGFYRSLDLYMHASFAETMCTSVMQAMACGVPVIGSDIPGINDLLPENDECIKLLPNQSEQQWMNNLLLYIKDSALRKTRAISARNAALKFFSIETTFKEYSNLIINKK